MSVLIKGMEMPQSCYDCPLAGDFKCNLMPSIPALCKEYDMAVQNEKRLNNCPLIPVPPHGRLIDADALQKDIQKHADLFVNCGNLDLAAMAQRDGLSCALSDVVNAPTIIEAEEGE